MLRNYVVNDYYSLKENTILGDQCDLKHYKQRDFTIEIGVAITCITPL